MAINMCSSSSHSHAIYLSSLQSKFPLKTTHSLSSSSPSKLCFNVSDSNVVLVSETMPCSSPDIKLLEKKLWEKEIERDWKEGVGVRRKKRRKRRSCEAEEGCGEIKHIFSRSKTKRAGQHYLTSKEEAEYIFLIKEEAKLEAMRRKILETTKHDPTLNQLADIVGVSKSSLDKILCGGRESRERITVSYKRLVVSIASNYQGRGLNMQDLVQEGSIGLLRGVKKFNPERGYKLSTYVYWWIRQAIAKSVASKSRTIRLPGSACELIPKIVEANNSLAVRLRRSPSFEEIAKSVGTTVRTVRLIYRSIKEPVSLDRALTSQGCMNLQVQMNSHRKQC
ncbi:RNA polymerase sigma factor sigD, chloroplastic isoform X2 [Apium graveolens]|uniref:RNA polymerase sigma factor sigD, chloroplastic isoform X2 n=1 Tax=Apium graveolens TaxID=4045 RepID=UPI003D7A3E2D